MRSAALRRTVVVLFVLLHVGTAALASARVCCDHDAMLPDCCRDGGPDHRCPFSQGRLARNAGHHDGHQVDGHHEASVSPHTGAAADDVRDVPRMRMACGAGHDVGVPVLGFPGLPVASHRLILLRPVSAPALSSTTFLPGRDVAPASPPPRA